jgi:hypothetical protein
MDYQIVVPSRKRTQNMLLIRQLLPSAIICVDEREAQDYARFVPKENLLLHPPIDFFAPVLNWILDNVSAEILVEVDDDFSGVQVMTGSRRYITDPEEILAIIENGARACQDLGLTTFCWSGTGNGTFLKPEMIPIKPVQAIHHAFGLMGAARRRHWRGDLPGRTAIDVTLTTLLLDRCIYADTRFWFDCGSVFAGRGGNVGLVDVERWKHSSRELKRTWGKSISFKPPRFGRKRDVDAMALKVTRTNNVAQR